MRARELIEFLTDYCEPNEEVYFVEECGDITRIVSAEYDYPNYVNSCMSDCLLEDDVVIVPPCMSTDRILWSEFEYDIDGKLYPTTEKKYCREIPMLSAYEFSIVDLDYKNNVEISLNQLIARGRNKYQNEPLLYRSQVEDEVRETMINTDPDYQKYLELKAKYESKE